MTGAWLYAGDSRVTSKQPIMRLLRLAVCLVIAAGAVSASSAQAASTLAPRLTLDHAANGPLVGAATWRVASPVSVRMGYNGNDPDRPQDTRGGHYAGVVVEDSRGKLVGGTLFYGAYDGLGDAFPEGIGAHPDLKLTAGTYRLIYFTDAPSRVSFAILGKGARALTVRSWRAASDYKATWQAFGLAGNGAATVQQDLPLALRTATVVHYWIYHAYTGPGVGNGHLCLLPQARRGTCGTSTTPDSSYGGDTCCLWGAALSTGVINGRGFAAGTWDLEVTETNVAVKQEAGFLALVKN